MRLKASFMKGKAKSKRRRAKSRTIPTWRLKAKPNTGPGKLKKRSGRSKKYSRSKLGGLCAGHVFCVRGKPPDAPPFHAQYGGVSADNSWALGVVCGGGPSPPRPNHCGAGAGTAVPL